MATRPARIAVRHKGASSLMSGRHMTNV
jgi:hypothetical protein